MAQIPSTYFGEYMESHQSMGDNYPSFPDPFMSQYPSNTTISNYSMNAYQQGYSHSMTSHHNHQGGTSVYTGQYESSSLGSCSSSLGVNNGTYFKNEPLTDTRESQQMSLKIPHHFDNKYSTDELDEPLNELPLESLLQITHQEGQLIKESEEEDIRTSVSNQMSLSMAQKRDFHSSCHSSKSGHFFLEDDKDEEDSESCLSSSTLYSVSSPPEILNSTSSLSRDYDISSHSSMTTPNPLSPPYESPSFAEIAVTSQPYTSHNNATSPNTCPRYSNVNGNVTDSSFFSSNHIPSSPEQIGNFKPFKPDCRRKIQNFDCIRDFDTKYLTQNTKEDITDRELHHVKKKTKLTKKSSKPAQATTKRSKKCKIKEQTNPDSPIPCSEEGDFSSDDSSRLSNESIRKAPGNPGIRRENSSKNVFSSPSKAQSETEKTIPPRKRMRCPRGMTLEKKPCTVCGDVAKNMHFGGLVCDSCKAFFRRSVQSGTWDTFKCEKEENCTITKSNRRSCQYCRFQKCESVGMLKEWVMTESGRMRLMKNRLAKSRQITVEKEKDKIYGDLPRGLDEDDAVTINNIMDTMHRTFASLPFPRQCNGDSIDSLSNIFVFLCKRFGQFFLKITDSTDLCQEDKTLLLKNGIGMSLYITGAHMYDPELECWPASTTHEAVKVPKVTLDTLQRVAQIPDAFSTIMKFYKKYENDLKDHVVAALMYLISFFLPEDPNFLDPSRIKIVQDRYIEYLKRYLIARDGYRSVTGIFVKLMEGLSYIKEILKFHSIVDIKPTIDHKDLSPDNTATITQCMTNLIHQIQESLKGNFPPYASVLNEDERNRLSKISNTSCSMALSKRRPGPMMQNHPVTIAVFGSTTRTDTLITQPLQKMIDWQKIKDDADPLSPSLSDTMDSIGYPGYDNTKNHEFLPALESFQNDSGHLNTTSKQAPLRRYGKIEGMGVSEEVDVDAVCEILKRLSHTDDVKVFSMLKENIPRELLERFSRTLSDDDISLSVKVNVSADISVPVLQ